MVSIPGGETRKIAQLPVFAVTAAASLLAYVWLLLILKVLSPGVVEVWEAALTLVAFLGLVLAAFAADKRLCCPSRSAFRSPLSFVLPSPDLNQVPAASTKWALPGRTVSIAPETHIPNGKADEFGLKGIPPHLPEPPLSRRGGGIYKRGFRSSLKCPMLSPLYD